MNIHKNLQNSLSEVKGYPNLRWCSCCAGLLLLSSSSPVTVPTTWTLHASKSPRGKDRLRPGTPNLLRPHGFPSSSREWPHGALQLPVWGDQRQICTLISAGSQFGCCVFACSISHRWIWSLSNDPLGQYFKVIAKLLSIATKKCKELLTVFTQIHHPFTFISHILVYVFINYLRVGCILHAP